MLDDLTLSDAPDGNRAHSDLLACRRNAEQLPNVGSVGRDPSGDPVSLSDQVLDDVGARGRGVEHEEDQLPAFPGGRDAGKRVVLDEVRSQKFVDERNIPGLTGRVDRLEVAANEGLVLLETHTAPPLPDRTFPTCLRGG